MSNSKSFRAELERAKKEPNKGKIREWPASTEAEKSYDLFYPVKTLELSRPQIPLEARGGRMIEHYYQKHQKPRGEEVSPYGLLSENNPRLVKFAIEQGISPRRFIENIIKFRKEMERYRK